MSEPPRYAPDHKLPPYAFLPNVHPHPRTQPGGHSYKQELPEAPPLEPERWGDSAGLRFGVDLFNRGYYWEAHEAWEAVWQASGRTTDPAQFVQALIMLAGARLKQLTRSAKGTRMLAEGAMERLERLRAGGGGTYAGASLERLWQQACRLRDAADGLEGEPARVSEPPSEEDRILLGEA